MLRQLAVALFMAAVAGCSTSPAESPAHKDAATTKPSPPGPAVFIQSLNVRAEREKAILPLFGPRQDRGFERDGRSPAIRLSLHLVAPDLHIIALDGLQLSSVRDDRGRNLELPAEALYRRNSTFLERPVSHDGHHVFADLDILGSATPGASTLTLQGTFNVRTGADLQKTTEQLPLHVGAAFTVDHTTFTVNSINKDWGGRRGTTILFKVDGTTDQIHEVVLEGGEGVMADRPFRVDRFLAREPATWFYYFPQSVSAVSVHASWDKQQTTVAIPFTLETGIGLAVPLGSPSIAAIQAAPLPSPAAGATVLHPEPVGLLLQQPISEQQYLTWFPHSTTAFFSEQRKATLTCFVEAPEPIVSMTPFPLHLTAVSDDRGTDLFHGADGNASVEFGAEDFYPRGNLTVDRRGFLFSIGLARPPAPGAKSITVRGTLEFASTTKATVIETKNVPMEIDATIPAGPVTLTIIRVASYGRGVVELDLFADKSPDSIEKLDFFDSSGKPVPLTSWAIRDRSRPDSDWGHTIMCTLKSLPDAVTCRITCREKSSSKSYPVSLTTTIGL